MYSHKNLLIISGFIQLIVHNIQTSELCDRSQNILVDSVLNKRTDSQNITLFSGEDVYQLEVLEEGINAEIKAHIKLKDLHKNLIPPIDVAYVNKSHIHVWNKQNQIEWIFTNNWTLIGNTVINKSLTKDYFEAIYMPRADYGVLFFKDYSSGTGIEYIQFGGDSGVVFVIREEIDRKWFKGIDGRNTTDIEKPGNKLFNELNGNRITAAFRIISTEGTALIYFGGRYVCRMNFSRTQWQPFCDIEDISDWIDCNNPNNWVEFQKNYTKATEMSDTTTPQPLNTIDIVAIILICITVLVIIVIILIWIIYNYWGTGYGSRGFEKSQKTLR